MIYRCQTLRRRHVAVFWIACLCGIVPQAHALRPPYDFFISIDNASGQTIGICSADLARCSSVPPRELYRNAVSMGRPQLSHLDRWLAGTVVKACDKVIPLAALVGAPRVAEDVKSLSVQLSIDTERYRRACATAAPSSTTR